MSDESKKVLVFGMTDNPGGIESLLLNVLAAQGSGGVIFDFLANTTKVAFEDKLLDSGSKVYRIHARHDDRRMFYRDLDLFFERHAAEYGAIWQNTNSLANIDYLIYAKRYGIPVRIIHGHNSMNVEGTIRGALHRINRMRIRSIATHFWSVSDTASEWFYGKGYKELPNYRVITNTIDAARFRFSEVNRNIIRSKLGLSSDVLLIGTVGRLHRQKNQKLIIDVVAELIRRGVEAHALLIGDGPLRERLINHADRSGVLSRTHFVGAVRETKEYYDAMDLFLFPSLCEGLGIALLEAQANGLPCLISDSIPLDGVVNPNVSVGRLSDSASQWADAALSLVGQGRLINSMIFGSKFDSALKVSLFADIL